MPTQRQPIFITVAGRKNVGKTYTTIKLCKKYLLGDKEKGIKGRKVLIFDTNNEKSYAKIRTINVNNFFNKKEKNYIRIFSSPKYHIDIRRIAPFNPYTGEPLSTDEMAELLMYVMENFYGGLLIIEDIVKFVSDSIQKDIVGSLATMRHKNCDIITHFQYKKKLFNPKIYGNTDMIRIHKTNDSFYDYLTHIKGDKNLLLIAEHLVEYQNTRSKYLIEKEDGKIIYSYYCYADLLSGKILGEYDEKVISEVLDKFISINSKTVLKELTNEINPMTGKPKYTLSEAYEIKKKQLRDEYFY